MVAVTVGNCQSLNLPVEPDPEPLPEHVVIKFDDCFNSQIETKAKYLKKSAEARGWLYHAELDA